MAAPDERYNDAQESLELAQSPEEREDLVSTSRNTIDVQSDRTYGNITISNNAFAILGDVTYQIYQQQEGDEPFAQARVALDRQQAFIAAVLSAATRYGIAVPDDQSQTHASVARWVREVYDATMSATSAWDGETSRPVPASTASLKRLDQLSLTDDVNAGKSITDDFIARVVEAERTTLRDRVSTIEDDSENRPLIGRPIYEPVHRTPVTEEHVLEQPYSYRAGEQSGNEEVGQTRGASEPAEEQSADIDVNGRDDDLLEDEEGNLVLDVRGKTEGERAFIAEYLRAQLRAYNFSNRSLANTYNTFSSSGAIPKTVERTPISEFTVKHTNILPLKSLIDHRLRRKRDGGNTQPLSGKDCLRKLASPSRSFIFLIDDSETMRAHKDEVTQAVTALTWLLKTYTSKNCIHVCFMQSPLLATMKRKSSGLRYTLHEAMREAKGTSDVTSRLREIVPVYFCGLCGRAQRQYSLPGTSRFIDSRYDPLRTFLKSSETNGEMKPLMIYIMTDAVWQPSSDLTQAIPMARMISPQIASSIPFDQLSIQFISVHASPENETKLRHVVQSLQGSRIPSDVEPITGDVYKMLLGSITRSPE